MRHISALSTAAAGALVGGLLLAPSSASAAGAVFCEGHRATIVGTQGNDVINGTSHGDVIAALGGKDVVHGGAGNDIICGNDGQDTLYGGSGNDQLFGGRDNVRFFGDGTLMYEFGDVLDGGPGDDRLSGGADSRRSADCAIGTCTLDRISWHSSPRGVLIHIASGTADGDGHDRFGGNGVEVDGSTFGDTIYGSAGSDAIAAGGGDDWVDAEGGNDAIFTDLPTIGFEPPAPANLGNVDRVFAGAGNDGIHTDAGPDIVHAGSGNDFLGSTALPGAAVQFFGESGNDIFDVKLVGAPTAPQLDGGSGTDDFYLLQEEDDPPNPLFNFDGTWNMTSGAMTLVAGAVHTTVSARNFENAGLGGRTWTIQGTDGPNRVMAGGAPGGAVGPVDFTALGGDDAFQGTSSDDTFNGGPGNDRSLGMGDGTDTCISVEVFDLPDCENITP